MKNEQDIEIEKEPPFVQIGFLVWPNGDPNPIFLWKEDLTCSNDGKWILDSIIDLYYKYLKKKYYIFKLHFYNNFFFKKLMHVHDISKDLNGFEK